MHLKMNGVSIKSLSYSVSISQYNVQCLQQISRVVFILNTTQVYYESRLFCLISFPTSFMVVKMNQLIMSVLKDFPCICFIDKYFFYRTEKWVKSICTHDDPSCYDRTMGTNH